MAQLVMRRGGSTNQTAGREVMDGQGGGARGGVAATAAATAADGEVGGVKTARRELRHESVKCTSKK